MTEKERQRTTALFDLTGRGNLSMFFSEQDNSITPYHSSLLRDVVPAVPRSAPFDRVH
jgi:hypothetical protein